MGSYHSTDSTPVHTGYTYTVEAFYTVPGTPFGTFEIIKVYLDYLDDPTVADVDRHIVARFPEWKTRPHRVYSYARNPPLTNIPLSKSDKVKSTPYLFLNHGKNEVPIPHSEYTKPTPTHFSNIYSSQKEVAPSTTSTTCEMFDTWKIQCE